MVDTTVAIRNPADSTERKLEQILSWCIRVEHRFSGAFESLPLSSALAAEATTALTSAAKASPFFCIHGMHD